MIVKIKDWKVAKVFKEDSTVILKIISLALQSLKFYSHYKPVANLLRELDNCKIIIEAHKNTADKILSSAKGKSGGESSGQ